MNEELYGLLGLDPEKIRQQQVTQGLLGAGLQLLAGSGYSPVRRTTGELLGQAGMAGMQGYQQAGESAIDRALKGMQVRSMIDRQRQQQQLQSLIPQAFQITRSPETREKIASELGDDEIVRPGVPTGVKIDPAKLQALMMLPGGAEAVKSIAETQKLVRQAGLGVGGAEAPSPFAPYLSAQSPQVKSLAQTYEQGFRSGVIDEETAYKRIDALARMEDAYAARDQSRLDRLSREATAKADRDFQRSMKETDLTEKLQSQIKGVDLSAKALTDLKELVTQKGVSYFKRDEDYSDLQTAYQKALFNLKDLYELGALQAGDVEQINKLLQDPTSISGYYLGKEGVLRSIESVEGLVKDRAEALKRVTPERFKSMVNVPNFPSIQDIKKKFGLEGK